MEKFRSTEISDPGCESDNLRFITVKTPNLKGRGDICVFVPPIKNLKNIPLVILLHGVYGSAWVWPFKGGAHQTALRLMLNKDISPMVIAMPSDGLWGDGSGYIPHSDRNFERWIIDDVPAAVIENIPAISEKSVRFISGLSMGGFGALRLGIKYANLFKAVSAHSAITHLEQMALFVEEPLECYFQKDNHEHSVWEMIKSHKGTLPRLRFDCGTEDQLIAYNRELNRQLLSHHIEHIYTEFPGSHEWPYWQEHLKDTLRFFSGCI